MTVPSQSGLSYILSVMPATPSVFLITSFLFLSFTTAFFSFLFSPVAFALSSFHCPGLCSPYHRPSNCLVQLSLEMNYVLASHNTPVMSSYFCQASLILFSHD